MLFRKTETIKRGNYVYHFANGETSVINAADVGEELIRFLHSSDDSIVYNNIKNSRPKAQEWQKAGIEQWKEQHPGEKVPKNWNLSLDGLSQTEDADHSSYMKVLSEKIMDAENDPYREILYEVLEELSEDEQQLYQMYYLDGLSQTDIADVLDKSQNCISKRIRKLETTLKTRCKEN